MPNCTQPTDVRSRFSSGPLVDDISMTRIDPAEANLERALRFATHPLSTAQYIRVPLANRRLSLLIQGFGVDRWE